MKDEFMNEWKNSSCDAREELIRRLFGILDVVHEECQNSVQYRINGTEVSQRILEEFRLRVMKMVVGETWKDALPLRIEALKRMHRYRNREMENYSTNHLSRSGLKHRAKNLTVKKLKKTVVGHSTTSWTAVFNDLLLTSGSRLAPLLFFILDENQIMEEQLGGQLKATIGGSWRAMSSRSVQSCSSGGSSSNRMIPASSEGDKESFPQYYKSLNSDLNAKLKLLKQNGLVDGNVTKIKDNTSDDSGGGFYPNTCSRHNEDDFTTTPRSEETGEIPSRSFTSFSDETPPPWSQPTGPSNEGVVLTDSFEGLKLDQGSLLTHSSSLKVHKEGVQDRGIKKSASYQAPGFSFTPQVDQSCFPAPINCNTEDLNPFRDPDPMFGFKSHNPENYH